VINQKTQQNIQGNESLHTGNDSLGNISIKQAYIPKSTITFPYKKGTTHVAKTTANVVVVPQKDTTTQIVVQEPQVVPVQDSLLVQETISSGIVVPFAKQPFQYIEPNFTINMFEYGNAIDYSHQLKKVNKKEFVQEFKDKVFVINYKEINNTTHNWMFWLLLIGFIVFGWTRLFYRKQLDLMFSSIFHYNLAVKSIRNSSDNSQRFSGILQFLFSVNIALFSYQVFDFFYPVTYHGLKSTAIVLIVSIVFLMIYGVKDFVYKTFGYIFAEISFVQEYLFNVHMYNRVLGIFLFPVVVAFAFIQTDVINHRLILYAGLGVILTFFILRIIRGIQISIKSNISILYMFLYFCTFEILPIVLLGKVGAIVMKMFYL
jgi:hypothetical protein